MKKIREGLIIFGIVVVFLSVHYPVIKPHLSTNGFKGVGFEDRKLKIGDYTYYLHGALSILDFQIEKKFNDKYQPIMAQARPIRESDMPWFAKYVLIAYPYPSFKFGFSLTAALLTAPFPQSFFMLYIPRLIFANILLSILVLILIYLIVIKLTNSRSSALIASLFFIFDVSNAHNNYNYQSHTICGIFYFLLAFYLSIQKEKISFRRFGVISFLLAFAIFSSSHVVPLSVITGFIVFSSLIHNAKMKDIFCYALSGFIGLIITPLYIIGAETFFRFKTLGLPNTMAQLANYSSTVKLLINTYPVHLRFIWDLRLFNIFVMPVLFITLFIAVYNNMRNLKKK